MTKGSMTPTKAEDMAVRLDGIADDPMWADALDADAGPAGKRLTFELSRRRSA